jgi:hypothetical protein
MRSSSCRLWHLPGLRQLGVEVTMFSAFRYTTLPAIVAGQGLLAAGGATASPDHLRLHRHSIGLRHRNMTEWR